MSLPLRMFLALALGLGSGIIVADRGSGGTAAMLAIATPIGSLWLDALTMTIVPLVFGLIVNGISSAAAEAKVSRTAFRSLLWFAILLTIACTLAATLTTTLLHFWPIPDEASSLKAAAPAPVATTRADPWYDGIIPDNPIRAAAETAMVPLVVFALLFGFALTRIEAPLRAAMLTFTQAVVQVMLVLVHWVLWLAPLGIAALSFIAGVNMGSAAAGALAQYVVIISAACLIATAMAYPAAIFAGRAGPLRFARAAISAQAVALGTQSSLATLPVMLDSASAIGVAPRTAGVTLPLAVSLFRAASAAANVSVAIYLAHLHSIPLSFPMIVLAILVAVPVSLAAIGVAAQVSFVATIAPICVALDIPIHVLPLLMAVETIPDFFRTLGNVTNDLAVATIVGKDDSQPASGS